jgi:hypothetical protein
VKNYTDQSTNNEAAIKRRPAAHVCSTHPKGKKSRKPISIKVKHDSQAPNRNNLEQKGTKETAQPGHPTPTLPDTRLRIAVVDESAPAEILAIKHRVPDPFSIPPSRPSRQHKLGI